jgi:hypothetical protein
VTAGAPDVAAAQESKPMSPEELRDTVRQRPFEPFRLVMTDGTGFEIRHPDLLWVGRRSAMVGLTGDPGQTFFERAVRIDLLHTIRLEPLQPATPPPQNRPA